ncbi:hypothetical protein [Marinicella meishanensis]|uniref:hypothetical protein n=1 Tax=Marinicella meishanensis TaxID=2873263 RepID=UPI001CC0A0B7|nr:hypothetical protein [Marinicella sp. NBU2979]
MTQAEFLVEFGWVIAVVVSVGVISWAILLLQAVFHDKRIALVGVFGALLVAYPAVFPELVPVAVVFKYVAAGINLLFLGWFLLTQYKKPVVYLPVLGLLLCALVGYRLYEAYQLAL